ncbi:MAG: hypothetical protein IJQ28_05355 [Clostridia bacterium]|nr:hypothetical protein [Clostridia bacterium]
MSELQKLIKLLTDVDRLEQENAELKEKIIKLTEENGNLIINRNTVENKLRDTESRLISVQKANTHNLVLLQRRNNTLEEIRGICKNVAFSNSCDNCDGIGYYEGCLDDDCGNYACFKILDKINEVLGND